MWGKPPFYIADNLVLEVRNLEIARKWYKEKLGFSDVSLRRDDDSGRPFADLGLSDDSFVTLIEIGSGSNDPQSGPESKPILFAHNLEKAHNWMANRGIAVGPITADSGGNRLFHFQDADGNSIEVCKEP